MNFSFMIPLTIVFVATYFFKKSADEIAYLSGIVIVIGLLLSLILAPWQIQLLLLVIAAISTLKLRQPNQTITEIEIDQKPSLLYRGSNYELNSSNPNNIEIADADLEGKYRGQVWKNHLSEEPAIPQTFQLTYRGSTVECQKYVVPSEEENGEIQVNRNSPTD
ncbi:DUF4278 domain-containing protein [Phormidium sp. LEGE 05292]|uniref:DUF4278 domain-containing protein n=1 Tax=[Phormidium] sp. LEGE 05292 TaxID=767427 RepID=UPI00187DE462|nr:DUF4278 domain-containing protein [Phormidium sp. LEGE 05292]MBE9227206.1 DUF4278 domain-containing protein [Phormidium sp. LEGE 05292]